jgi:hypothetical protein
MDLITACRVRRGCVHPVPRLYFGERVGDEVGEGDDDREGVGG